VTHQTEVHLPQWRRLRQKFPDTARIHFWKIGPKPVMENVDHDQRIQNQDQSRAIQGK
jgi:hypothetical protein